MPLERQEDLHATLAISPQEAERGTIRTLSLPGQRQVRITVPAQTRHGQVLRLEGLGMAAYEGGPRSALQLTIAIVEENATQRSPNIRGYASTETAREPEQIRPNQAIPPWEMPPDRPHSRGYPPPPTFYPGQANSPAIPFYGDRLPEPSSRKRNLTAWLLLILALLALSGSAELFYSNYLQRAQGPQKATSNTPSVVHAAQATTTFAATATVQSGNPYAPGTSKLLLNDPLNKPSTNWQTDTHDALGGACVFTNNVYHVEETQKGYFRICSEQSVDVSDFTFEVHMQIISGHCGGILFRQISAGQYYLYKVCSDGYYGLTRFTDNTGKNSFSLNYATSSAVHQGKVENVIAIVAQGPRIHLYANNIDIGDFNDGHYLHGAFGLIADYKDAAVDVAYSSVRIWSLVV